MGVLHHMAPPCSAAWPLKPPTSCLQSHWTNYLWCPPWVILLFTSEPLHMPFSPLPHPGSTLVHLADSYSSFQKSAMGLAPPGELPWPLWEAYPLLGSHVHTFTKAPTADRYVCFLHRFLWDPGGQEQMLTHLWIPTLRQVSVTEHTFKSELKKKESLPWGRWIPM